MYFLKKLQKVTLAQFQGDINSYCDLKIIIKKDMEGTMLSGQMA